jgi:hypothetical protein
MKYHSAVIITFLFILAPPAQAEDNRCDMSAGRNADTLGIGPEIDYRITPFIGVRTETTIQTINRSFSAVTIGHNGTAKLRSGSFLADVFPFRNGFRFSGGLRIYSNKTWGLAKPGPSTAYTINGKIYSAAQIRMLAANATFASVAPVVTIGYAAQFSRHMVFGIGAGALFRSGVKGNQQVIGGACAPALYSASCRGIMAGIDAEHQADSRNINRYKAYPLVQFKLGLRF